MVRSAHALRPTTGPALKMRTGRVASGVELAERAVPRSRGEASMILRTGQYRTHATCSLLPWDAGA